MIHTQEVNLCNYIITITTEDPILFGLIQMNSHVLLATLESNSKSWF